MSQGNPFADEWRECLRAHYTDVVRRDARTIPSLNTVMAEVGFGEEELRELTQYAKLTLRAEDMPDDSMPDTSFLDTPAIHAVPEIPAPPDVAPVDAPVEEVPADAPVDELVSAEEVEVIADAETEPPPDEPEADAPQQLSLF